MEPDTRITRLIARKILGQELPAEEQATLAAWLDASPGNRKLYERVQGGEDTLSIIQIEQAGYGSLMSERFMRSRVTPKPAVAEKRLTLWAAGVAASAAVLARAMLSGPGEGRTAARLNAPASLRATKAHAMLTLADGRSVDLTAVAGKSGATDVRRVIRSTAGIPPGDDDAKASGIANNDPRILGTGRDADRGRRILVRYTLVDFATPAEWRKWYETHKDNHFFTESGGWLFLIDRREPGLNDYKSRQERMEADRVATGATSDAEPVAVAAEAIVTQDGGRMLHIKATIHPGYPINNNVAKTDVLIPTKVEVILPEGYKAVGGLKKPAGKFYNSNGTTVYKESAVLSQEFAGTGEGEVKCRVTCQCCDPTIGFPPATRENTVNLSAAPTLGGLPMPPYGRLRSHGGAGTVFHLFEEIGMDATVGGVFEEKFARGGHTADGRFKGLAAGKTVKRRAAEAVEAAQVVGGEGIRIAFLQHTVTRGHAVAESLQDLREIVVTAGFGFQRGGIGHPGRKSHLIDVQPDTGDTAREVHPAHIVFDEQSGRLAVADIDVIGPFDLRVQAEGVQRIRHGEADRLQKAELPARRQEIRLQYYTESKVHTRLRRPPVTLLATACGLGTGDDHRAVAVTRIAGQVVGRRGLPVEIHRPSRAGERLFHCCAR